MTNGLRIKNVTLADDGEYTCRAEVETDGRYDERKISVAVHSKFCNNDVWLWHERVVLPFWNSGNVFFLEYDNICACSARNRLTINTDKTKEIILYRPASRQLNIPPPMPDIERVAQATLLGIDITSTLSTAAYVNRMLLQINQRLYLLSQLKSQGMAVQALHQLFTGLIMSKIA